MTHRCEIMDGWCVNSLKLDQQEDDQGFGPGGRQIRARWGFRQPTAPAQSATYGINGQNYGPGGTHKNPSDPNMLPT